MTLYPHLVAIHPHVLRAVEIYPVLMRREFAKESGVSFGKAHYCIKALLEKGMDKIENFSLKQKKLE